VEADQRPDHHQEEEEEEEEDQVVVPRPHHQHQAVEREDSLMSDRTLSNRSSVSSGKVGPHTTYCLKIA
jgi:hypothetical protein